MPRALHAHLSRLAEEEGVSLNQLLVALLAGGSRFKMPLDDRKKLGPAALERPEPTAPER